MKKRNHKQSNNHPEKKIRFEENSGLDKSGDVTPEQFVAEGEERDGETILRKRTNAQKMAKKFRTRLL